MDKQQQAIGDCAFTLNEMSIDEMRVLAKLLSNEVLRDLRHEIEDEEQRRFKNRSI